MAKKKNDLTPWSQVSPMLPPENLPLFKVGNLSVETEEAIKKKEKERNIKKKEEIEKDKEYKKIQEEERKKNEENNIMQLMMTNEFDEQL